MKVGQARQQRYRWLGLGSDPLVVIVSGALAISSAHGEVKWVGTAADNNWSTSDNWTPQQSPAGEDVLFGEDDRTLSTTVNSIISADTAIRSLRFQNTNVLPPATNRFWHVLQIDSGTTLTINGNTTTPPANVLEVGNLSPQISQQRTNVRVTGGGALAVNGASSNVIITQISSGDNGIGRLELNELSSFSASVNNFYVGRGSRSNGVLLLAATGTGANQIMANVLSVGDTADSNEKGGTGSTLSMGISNTLHVDDIFVGAPTDPSLRNTGNGTLNFQAGLTGASVTIRGAAGGTTRADLTIASHGVRGSSPSNARNTNRSLGGSVNFTGGTVDARLGAVLIASGQGINNSGQSGGVTGTLSMAAGTVDAESVVLGRTVSNSSSDVAATGNLNVSGGSFTTGTMFLANNVGGTQSVAGNLNISGTGQVHVTGGGITMGFRASANTGSNTVLPAINLTGGSLSVAGNIIDNDTAATDISSVVNISGGTLDLSSSVAADIAVDTLSLTSTGKLKLFVGDAGVNSAILGNANTPLAHTATLDAALEFDLTGASTVLGDSWEIVDPTSVSVTYGSNFNVTGFTQDGVTWVRTIGNAEYRYDTTTGVLMVPEPASMALMSVAGLLLTRRRKAVSA
jgi:hypothetical protein